MYVKLTLGDPADKPLVWYVGVVVVRENGRPVVDDVLYLKNKDGEVKSRLSKDLSSGCDGACMGRRRQPAPVRLLAAPEGPCTCL